MSNLPDPLPIWIPEPYRSLYQETGSAFVAGFAGSFIAWASDRSPFRFLLDPDQVRDLLLLPGVVKTDAGPV